MDSERGLHTTIALYHILHELKRPVVMAILVDSSEFRARHLVELLIGRPLFVRIKHCRTKYICFGLGFGFVFYVSFPIFFVWLFFRL